MKLIRNSLLTSLIIIVWISCLGKKEIGGNSSAADKEIKDARYYSMLIDAKKMELIYDDYRYAINRYEKCIELFPERAAPYYQLSGIYMNMRDIERGLKYGKEACERDTTNEWYKLHLATIYQYAGKLDSAVMVYEKLNKYNNSDEIRYNLALLYSQIGEGEKAMKLINKMEEENKESREILMLKHNVYNGLKYYDSAVYMLELVAKYFPDDPNSYGMLAEYLTEIGKTEYAKKIYKESIRKDSTNGLILLSFAEYYMQEGYTDSAFVYYDKAFCCSDLDIDDKISVILKFISNIEFLKQYKTKIINTIHLIPHEQRKFSYYAAMADIDINLEDYKDAKPFLDSALIYEKKNFLLWEQTLLVNNFLNNHDEVIRISTEALHYFKDKPNLYLVRAYSFRDKGMYEKAMMDIDSTRE